MAGQPQDACDFVIHDMDFRFRGPGIYGDSFYNQFYLDEECRFHHDKEAAFRSSDGDRVWFRHGLRHRDGDLPAVEAANGERAWYQNGVFHREGGPAIKFADGREEWWNKGRKLEPDEVKGYTEWLVRSESITFDSYLRHKEFQQTLADIQADFTNGLEKKITALKPPRLLK